jgi:predicted GNAT family acetyltransferase
VDLQVKHDSATQEFFAEFSGERAVLDYRHIGGVMSIVHTEVPPAFRDHGIAAQLMRSALAVARDRGWKVDPACPYARDFMQREPQYSDLLRANDGERRHVDAQLDEALDESFPASDVPAIGGDN